MPVSIPNYFNVSRVFCFELIAFCTARAKNPYLCISLLLCAMLIRQMNKQGFEQGQKEMKQNALFDIFMEK